MELEGLCPLILLAPIPSAVATEKSPLDLMSSLSQLPTFGCCYCYLSTVTISCSTDKSTVIGHHHEELEICEREGPVLEPAGEATCLRCEAENILEPLHLVSP